MALLIRCLILSVMLTGVGLRAEKPRITSQDQLPRFSYPAAGSVVALVQDETAAAILAEAVRRDQESLLNDYVIEDRTTLQGIHGTLLNLELQAGRYAAAKERITTIRALEEKPAARLTTGLLAASYIEARTASDYASEEAFRAAFAQIYRANLNRLPWEVVGDVIKQTKASAEIVSPALVLGSLESQFQPGVDKTQTISGEVAQTLLAQRNALLFYLPLKEERVAALTAYVQAHQTQKADIWEARDIQLQDTSALTPVVVAIWDSGVDIPVFPGQQWRNERESLNGRDDDGNGFVDDVHGIAFDLQAERTPDLLLPLTAEQREAYPAMREMTKGLLDLQANVDSPEATLIKQRLGALEASEVQPFIESLSFFGNFTHGTHVAGIAAAGNPAVRLLTARMTYDHRMIPQLPTREQAEREAELARATIAYFQQAGVRVVNMSWGGSPRDIEAAFEANGAGGSPDERRQTAREYFELFRQAMIEGMSAAPEILFIAAAGNSDNDAAFVEFVPSGIDLPNVLTVGAVDQAGEETSFTSFGRNVDVHANGFEVESTLPGGDRMKYSGTSMAAPNVANLAAKLLALQPDLTTAQLTALIMDGADRSADGRINLINPQRTVSLLTAPAPR